MLLEMQSLTPAEERIIEAELSSGESVLWSGKPSQKVIFHKSDLFLVPLSLMWGGFTLFWEFGVSSTGGPSFMSLGGIPFVLVGQYLIWGRFLVTAWQKKRILYVLTNRRALVIVRPPQARTIAATLRSISTVQKEIRADGFGTITFGSAPIAAYGFGNRQQSWNGLQLHTGVPVFVDIESAAEVFAIEEKLRDSFHTEI
jgi:hypothetical protein